VVDDEPAIREIVKDTLQSLGYEVFVAGAGEEALEIAQNSGRKICLLLTDVIMPGMNGRELAARLTAIDPDMKVLFMSGYTDNIVIQQGVLEPGIMLVNQPLVPNLLARKIREILNKTAAV